MNATLNSVTAARFFALESELIPLVSEDVGGLSPTLERLIRVFDYSEIEQVVSRDRGYSNSRGVGQPEVDRCALACAFLAKADMDLKSTRALIDRLSVDKKLARLCGFDLRYKLPSESTFSRSFDEFAKTDLLGRIHSALVSRSLGDKLIGHINRDSTSIEARESLSIEFIETQKSAAAARAAKISAPAPKRGRPKKGCEKKIVESPAKSPKDGALEQQRNLSLKQMIAGLFTGCATGTKKNAKGHKTSWRGYKLHLDVACCGVPISAILTGANVHDSKVALPLMHMSNERVTACYELMDAAYCSKVIDEEVRKIGHIPLIDHNPRGGDKHEFAPHEAQRYKTRTGVERTNGRLKDEFGARHINVRGHAKVMCHLMFGIVALCVDQLTRLIL